MNNIEHQYLDLIVDIFDNGVKKQTRNGTVLSVFGRQIRHRFIDGFPLLTTKKMSLKNIFTELRWFLDGNTDIRYLWKHNCHIWDNDWYRWYCSKVVKPKTLEEMQQMRGDKNIPSNYWDLDFIYGAAWCDWPTDKIINFEIDKIKQEENIPFNITFNKLNLDFNHELVGTTFINNKNKDEFIIVKNISKGNRNSKFIVQSLSNGYSTITTLPQIKLKQTINPYIPNLFGMCCIGVPQKNGIKLKYSEYKDEYSLWYNMVARCYNVNSLYYKYYGDKGIYIDNKWKCFEFFYNDLPKVKNYFKWKSNTKQYDLDKDYYGKLRYSLDNCIFLQKKDNIKIKTNVPFKATNIITGKSEIAISQTDFGLKYSLNPKRISDALKNNRRIKDWKFEKIDYDKEKEVWRYKMSINQVENLIDKLKNDPDDRRMLVNAWKPDNLDNCALPPCHYSWQVWTRELTLDERFTIFNNKFDTQITKNDIKDEHKEAFLTGIPKRAISLMWNQRSVDIALGLPYNIASYGMLLMMIANEVNMIPEELIGNLADCHIYENQINGCDEQLKRDPTSLPQLSISKGLNAQYEDLVLTNYNPQPKIFFPLS
jgi:thymidylate synthase